MPRKIVKTHSGRIVEIYSIRLPNGNLLIQVPDPADRSKAIWSEVKPGSSEFKRWLPVAEDGADPRKAKA